MGGELVADVPADDLVLGGGAPVYHREFTKPAYLSEVAKFDQDIIGQPDYSVVAQFLLTHPNIASRNWVTQQYDSMVGASTLTTNKPSDAAVVSIKGTSKAISICVDCNGRYVYSNPEIGTAIAVAEGARNVVCSGGTPIAITNNLNFGNPYNTEVYWQFVHAIKGMKTACLKFSTPVTGGNVSFYNQSHDGGAVFPTPTIGMLGLLDDVATHTTLAFQQAEDLIYLLGPVTDDIACSTYVYNYLNIKYSPAPYFDLDVEFKVQQTVMSAIKEGYIKSAHDVSDGGLFVTLTEAAMVLGLGFEINTDPEVRKDAYLFGEGQSRIVVSITPDLADKFDAFLTQSDIPFAQIGMVKPSPVYIVDGQPLVGEGIAAEYNSVLTELFG
jgi:phosphoribosylformylglycinamidine synthase